MTKNENRATASIAGLSLLIGGHLVEGWAVTGAALIVIGCVAVALLFASLDGKIVDFPHVWG